MITVNVAGFLTDFTNGQNRIVLDSTPATVGNNTLAYVIV
jgi:hypothetical protein